MKTNQNKKKKSGCLIVVLIFILMTVFIIFSDYIKYSPWKITFEEYPIPSSSTYVTSVFEQVNAGPFGGNAEVETWIYSIVLESDLDKDSLYNHYSPIVEQSNKHFGGNPSVLYVFNYLDDSYEISRIEKQLSKLSSNTQKTKASRNLKKSYLVIINKQGRGYFYN